MRARGDKGGDANVGVWARTDDGYAWLAGFLTAERVHALLPETRPHHVDVHLLPNLRAVNVVVRGLLGRGVAENASLDPQAKALGEYLRAQVVELPVPLLPAATHGRRRVTTLAPITPRGRRTRDAVVRAAREVFEQRGFDGTRMSDITDAAGVSHGTVYTYFTSKEEVLAQVCDDLAGEVFAAVRVPDDLRADPVTRIHEGNRRYLRAYARNARMLEVVEQAATTNERFRSLVDGLRAVFVQKARASLEQYQDDGLADPALDPQIAGPALVRHGGELRPPLARPAAAAGRRPRRRHPHHAVGPGHRPARVQHAARPAAPRSRRQRMRFTQEHEQLRQVVRQVVENEINPHVDDWERGRDLPGARAVRQARLRWACSAWSTTRRTAAAAPTTPSPSSWARSSAAPTAPACRWPSPSRPRWRPRRCTGSAREELKQRYLAPAIRGEQVCSIAVSEPGAGSDVAGIRTRAVRDGDEWVINGSKMWITNGTQADWLCLLVRTSDEGGYAGMSHDRRPHRHPRVQRSAASSTSWATARSDTAELIFEDVPGAGHQHDRRDRAAASSSRWPSSRTSG